MARIRAYLTLIGDSFDCDHVTNCFQVQPDTVRTPNEKLGNGQAFGHSEWGIHTDIEIADEVEPLLKNLRGRMKCGTEAMRKVAEDVNAEWHHSYYLQVTDGDMPVLYFSAESIQFLAEIRAQLGFDMYSSMTRRGALKWLF